MTPKKQNNKYAVAPQKKSIKKSIGSFKKGINYGELFDDFLHGLESLLGNLKENPHDKFKRSIYNPGYTSDIHSHRAADTIGNALQKPFDYINAKSGKSRKDLASTIKNMYQQEAISLPKTKRETWDERYDLGTYYLPHELRRGQMNQRVKNVRRGIAGLGGGALIASPYFTEEE